MQCLPTGQLSPSRAASWLGHLQGRATPTQPCRGGCGSVSYRDAVAVSCQSEEGATPVPRLRDEPWSQEEALCTKTGSPGLLHAKAKYERELLLRVVNLGRNVATNQEVSRAVDELHTRRLLTRPEHFHTATSSLRKRRMWQEAVFLMDDLHAVIVERRLLRCSAWKQSLAELSKASHDGIAQGSCSEAMKACLMTGHWQWALHLFTSYCIVPDADMWKFAAQSCRDGGRWDMALHLLEDMQQSIVEPEASTHRCVIRASGEARQWILGLSAVRHMQQCSFELDVETQNVATSFCFDGWRWWFSLRLLDKLKLDALGPSLITYSAVIHACSGHRAQFLDYPDLEPTHRRWKEVLSLHNELQRQTIEADTMIYSNLISACGRSHHWEQALHLLRCIIAAPCDKDLTWCEHPGPLFFVYRAAIDACARGNQVGHTLQVLEDVCAWGPRPDASMCNAALGVYELQARDSAQRLLLGNEGAVVRLSVHAMWLLAQLLNRGFRPDILTYKSVLKTCEFGGHTQETPKMLFQIQDDALTLVQTRPVTRRTSATSVGVIPRWSCLVAEAIEILEHHSCLCGRIAKAFLRYVSDVTALSRFVSGAGSVTWNEVQLFPSASHRPRSLSCLSTGRILEQLSDEWPSKMNWRGSSRMSLRRAACIAEVRPMLNPSSAIITAWMAFVVAVPTPRILHTASPQQFRVRNSCGRAVGFDAEVEKHDQNRPFTLPFASSDHDFTLYATHLALRMLVDVVRRPFLGSLKSYNAGSYGFIECLETFAVYGRDVFFLSSDMPSGEWHLHQPISFRLVHDALGHPQAKSLSLETCVPSLEQANSTLMERWGRHLASTPVL